MIDVIYILAEIIVLDYVWELYLETDAFKIKTFTINRIYMILHVKLR